MDRRGEAGLLNPVRVFHTEGQRVREGEQEIYDQVGKGVTMRTLREQELPGQDQGRAHGWAAIDG